MKPTPPDSKYREQAEKLHQQLHEDGGFWYHENVGFIESALQLAAETARKEAIEECAKVINTEKYKAASSMRELDFDDMSYLEQEIRALAQKDQK